MVAITVKFVGDHIPAVIDKNPEENGPAEAKEHKVVWWLRRQTIQLRNEALTEIDMKTTTFT